MYLTQKKICENFSKCCLGISRNFKSEESLHMVSTVFEKGAMVATFAFQCLAAFALKDIALVSFKSRQSTSFSRVCIHSYDGYEFEKVNQLKDFDEEDAMIREDLKRELLLLSSVTNRGEYTSSEERDIIIDVVTQLGKKNSIYEEEDAEIFS
jgi:hypothetical protein